MKRRTVLKTLGAGTAALGLGRAAMASPGTPLSGPKRVLRIAHITDVHLRPEHEAPARFRRCLDDILQHKVDFFLNGGDTIYAADYDHITRERVLQQWTLWREARNSFEAYEVHSCLGNHDMWWAAPSTSDPMYGKAYALQQLEVPHRYYQFNKKGWHFFILDSNNHPAGSLDEAQRSWLARQLAQLPDDAHVLMMSHYPILGACTILGGGNHTDAQALTKLFYQHRGKSIHCLSGHVHLLDATTYNGVHYYCNGAMSGFWWEDGNEASAQRYWVHETPPGYAILDLYADGSVVNTYHPHGH